MISITQCSCPTYLAVAYKVNIFLAQMATFALTNEHVCLLKISNV